MKRSFKRVLSFFVVLEVLIGLMPAGAMAEQVNNVNYTSSTEEQAELPTLETEDLKTGKIEIIKDEVTADGYLTKEVKVPLIQEGVVYSENSIEANQFDSDLEKAIKDKIFNALTNRGNDLDLGDYQIQWSQSDKISTWFLELINDNPSFFYVSDTIKFTGNSEVLTGVNFNYNLKINEVDAYESAIQEILSYAKDEMTPAEKILAVHDAFIRNVEYDYANYKNHTIPQEDYTAYGALVNGVAVCEGYSLAFSDIMKRLGIEVITVNTFNHMWNKVKIDGSWYHIDSTWNDPQSHAYFLISDERMKLIGGYEHDIWGISCITKADNTKYEDLFFRDLSEIYYESGKWIYIKEHEIHSSKFDGSEDSVIVSNMPDDSTSFFAKYNDKLYYFKETYYGSLAERNRLYSCNIDGSNEILLCKIPVSDRENVYPQTFKNSTVYFLIVNHDDIGNALQKTEYQIDLASPVNIDPNVTYRTHVQNVGWKEYSYGGGMSGTSGKSLRLEGIEININEPDAAVGVEYSTHVQNIGWQDFVKDGAISGTEGKSLRLEAIKIKLTGADADKFDIYYQVHAQNYGWLDWAKNGESAGTAGLGYRLEAIRISVVPKGDPAPGATTRPFVQN